MKILGIVLALAAATADAAPLQFNLFCVAVIDTVKLPDGQFAKSTAEDTAPIRFKIDLVHNLWCDNTCAVPRDMHHDARMLYLSSGQFSELVDRTTGVYTYIMNLTPHSADVFKQYSCTPSEFTGFPKVRF